MTRQKDLKRLVRARMSKTGESYTSARAQLLRKQQATSRTSIAAVPTAAKASRGTPKPNEYAAIAGMADAVIKAKTGCTWARWVKALDHDGAHEMSHRDIAALVSKKYKTPSWWTQTVTVGYERIKGLRTRGQQRDGTFGATKSRTFNVPVATLFDAWVDEDLRREWLNGTPVRIRTATKPKSMRLDWPDQGIVAVGFTAKTRNKSAVALEHSKLSDREAANRVKAYWAERLDALAELLARQGYGSETDVGRRRLSEDH